MLTQAMIEAERERANALKDSRILLDMASHPEAADPEAWLSISIKNLMMGSHAGRIGYDQRS